MKANSIVVLALAVGLIFAFSNTAFGNGAEGPPGDVSKVEFDDRLEITGTFTARKFVKDGETKCIVTADLNWIDENGIKHSKKVYFDLPQPITKTQVCDYNIKQLGNVFKAKISADMVLHELNIDKKKKVLVLEKLIKTNGNCEGLPFHLQTIQGVISIKVEETQP